MFPKTNHIGWPYSNKKISDSRHDPQKLSINFSVLTTVSEENRLILSLHKTREKWLQMFMTLGFCRNLSSKSQSYKRRLTKIIIFGITGRDTETGSIGETRKGNRLSAEQAGKEEWTHHGTILEKSQPNTILWKLIPYKLWFRIFSEEMSGSNNVPHFPLQLCKKLGSSLELFWRKSKNLKKGYLSPIIQVFFQKEM